MSLILAEGFDDGLGLDRMTASGSCILSAAQQRTGTHSLSTSGASTEGSWTVAAADEHATFVVGFAYLQTSLGNREMATFRADGNGTTHVTLSSVSTGQLNVHRGTSGGTLLGSTDAGAITAGTWHYVECFVTLSDTVGVVKLRVDGETPTGWSDLTSQDTKNGGTDTVFDTAVLQTESNTIFFDDYYLFNGATSSGDNPNNDVIGDTSVTTIYPNGNGTTSALDGSDGNQTDNYQLVDETTPASADYTGSTTTGNRDTYAYSDVSTSMSNIYGLVVSSWAAKSSAGNRGFATIVRTSGSESTSANYQLQTSYAPHDVLYETNPNQSTEEWTATNVNAAEFGVVVTT